MRFVKTLSIMLCIIVIGLTFSACSESYKEAFIYVELESKPSTLDPQVAHSKEELTVVRSLFDTLLRFDDSGNVVPSAAESFEKNGTTYTFKLRKDAIWKDETPVTANDFVFAFRRAVDPVTSAPYANTLFAIENAEKIHSGEAPLNSLGVTAKDDYTLVIKLSKDDAEFEKVLTSAITMPCNEKFFNQCKGKYGLTIDTTNSNGSYYVRKWTKETKYLIRLAKNLEYTGPFEANSMRIYFTCSDKEAYPMLEHDNTDLIYISNLEYPKIATDFTVNTTEDICYTMYLSKRLDPKLREALLTSVWSDSYKNKLDNTSKTADTLYPPVLSANAPKVTEYIKYDPQKALYTYSELVKKGFSVKDITIKYPNTPTCTEIAKSIAGHWQQTLSCFINIEEMSEGAAVSALEFGNYDIIIAPRYSASGTISAYNSSLGYEGQNSLDISRELYSNHLAYPLFYSTTNIAAGEKIENLESSIQNGILDVSMLIKKQ